MLYHVEHETRYDYGSPVTLSRHVLHLAPRECRWQHTLETAIDISPSPTLQTQRDDAFGNPETRVVFESPHRTLSVLSRVTVEVGERPWQAGFDKDGAHADDVPWETVQAALRLEGDAPLKPRRFRFESPHVRVKNELAHFAQQSFAPDTGLLAGTRALVSRLHAEFVYDPDATTVGTSVMDVLARRRGVCQDFAHLAIGGLRSLGLAARYVSGYLCTEPPPGQPRLTGVDASHAWFAIWCPGIGWVEFDPTNDCLADTRHVVVAWGRDFGDVSPLRGVIQGGGGHNLTVKVTVTPA